MSTTRASAASLAAVVPDRLAASDVLNADHLRAVCMANGADDVGFVELGCAALDDDRDDIVEAFRGARSVIGFVVRMNREPIRSPARSVANLEFHRAGDHANEVACAIVAALERAGIRAVNPPTGFPMEMDRFPGKIWTISHKRVAEAAGLGVMGLHRNVIHPRFGNFVLLGSVVIDREVSAYGTPLDESPCFSCRLCVAACPVGAISTDGHFDFSACVTHNYREFMGGFTDWVESVADSADAADYQRRIRDPETVSIWQSLSFGANYKAAYCMAVCPAGDDVIGRYLADRARHLADVLKPLRDKVEPVYVIPGSDADRHVRDRFPHKEPRPASPRLRPQSIRGFLAGLPALFNRGLAGDLSATYHFTFTGDEEARATVRISGGCLAIDDGLQDECDLAVVTDSRAWLRFVGRGRGLVVSLLLGRVRLRGRWRLLAAFGRCFPQ